MKKKIIIASAALFFALATMFNINALQSNNARDISLDNIAIMAQAQVEQTDTGRIGMAGTNWRRTTFQCTRTVVVGFDFILQVSIVKTTHYIAEGCGFGTGWCLAPAGC